jgi:Xaa-Pro aminopeptidase
MRYESIPNSLFIKNRRNFIAQMKLNTIAILTSNDVKHTNADDVMGFVQNKALFYLPGVDQEETILVVYPDAQKEENREIIFIRETNAHIKIWGGEKRSKEQAIVVSGFERVEWTQDFEMTLL